ncbi:retrovirus-related Pol polyprotein from transposon RE1 [Trichonephila clavipes]|nr:retrovirus-related Pol polyprotein from transposon RE1 [Trichonephila clavipes]
MIEHENWDLVDPPENVKVLENRWVYTLKGVANNTVVRFKVEQGNTQLEGESLDEVLSPLVNFSICQKRRYDFDQSRRVLLSSDLRSISVLMAQMETDPPDIANSCEERNRLSLEIEALDIVINRCAEVNFPDTDNNHEMKAFLRASIYDTERKKDTMVSELRSLPPCMTFNCNGNYCTPPPPIPTEKHKDSDSNHILKNYSEAPTNANNAKKKNKKRKINKKDSVEDFVFPKKTARPVSPLPSVSQSL